MINLTEVQTKALQAVFEKHPDRDTDHVTYTRVPEFVVLMAVMSHQTTLIEDFVDQLNKIRS